MVVFILVSATALVAAGAWAVLRTPEWGATARILVSPLEQGDRTYVGTPVVRESASDPTRTMQTASTLDRLPQRGDAGCSDARGRLDGRRGGGCRHRADRR